MSGLAISRDYTYDGYGQKHFIRVEFDYISMTVAVNRLGHERVIFTWPQWQALRKIANEEASEEKKARISP